MRNLFNYLLVHAIALLPSRNRQPKENWLSKEPRIMSTAFPDGTTVEYKFGISIPQLRKLYGY